MAAKTARRGELLRHAVELEEDGHIVTSSWIREEEVGISPAESQAPSVAARNVEEIASSQVFLAYSELAASPHRGRGGRQVEFGIAVALGKRLILCGPPEHVFHRLTAVEHHDRFDAVRAALRPRA
jgi:hypothetical protein